MKARVSCFVFQIFRACSAPAARLASDIRISGLLPQFSTILPYPDSSGLLSYPTQIVKGSIWLYLAAHPVLVTVGPVPLLVYSVLAEAKRVCSRLSSSWPFFSSS